MSRARGPHEGRARRAGSKDRQSCGHEDLACPHYASRAYRLTLQYLYILIPSSVDFTVIQFLVHIFDITVNPLHPWSTATTV